MVGLVVAAAAGYVMGAKAGRARYEQIRRASKAVGGSPITRKLVNVGRQKLSDSLSTAPKLEPLHAIDEQTTIMVPHDQLRRDERSA